MCSKMSIFFYTNFRKFCNNMLQGPVLGLRWSALSWDPAVVPRSCVQLMLPSGCQWEQNPPRNKSITLHQDTPTHWGLNPCRCSLKAPRAGSWNPWSPHVLSSRILPKGLTSPLSVSSICPSGERGVLKESHPIRIKINKLHRKSQWDKFFPQLLWLSHAFA